MPHATSSHQREARQGALHDHQGAREVYAALDLGTNNCRLLIAVADPENASKDATRGLSPLKVIDSFSHIVKLGEGVMATGRLSDEAIERTLAALKLCRNKLDKYQLHSARFVATEACRRAINTPEFIKRAEAETGIRIDVISTEDEAHFAFLGCASLLKPDTKRAIVFDIGGGSTELMWIDAEAAHRINGNGNKRGSITDWVSMECGVMNLADRFGGPVIAEMVYEDMVNFVTSKLEAFNAKNRISEALSNEHIQLLSTSGTVTTLAAIHLGLPRYERARIDGITLPVADIRATTTRLLGMRPSERFNHPCIGSDRADFILSGCAIFDAISALSPTSQITIADRGVREGIIVSLMQAGQHG